MERIYEFSDAITKWERLCENLEEQSDDELRELHRELIQLFRTSARDAYEESRRRTGWLAPEDVTNVFAEALSQYESLTEDQLSLLSGEDLCTIIQEMWNTWKELNQRMCANRNETISGLPWDEVPPDEVVILDSPGSPNHHYCFTVDDLARLRPVRGQLTNPFSGVPFTEDEMIQIQRARVRAGLSHLRQIGERKEDEPLPPPPRVSPLQPAFRQLQLQEYMDEAETKVVGIARRVYARLEAVLQELISREELPIGQHVTGYDEEKKVNIYEPRTVDEEKSFRLKEGIYGITIRNHNPFNLNSWLTQILNVNQDIDIRNLVREAILSALATAEPEEGPVERKETPLDRIFAIIEEQAGISHLDASVLEDYPEETKRLIVAYISYIARNFSIDYDTPAYRQTRANPSPENIGEWLTEIYDTSEEALIRQRLAEISTEEEATIFRRWLAETQRRYAEFSSNIAIVLQGSPNEIRSIVHGALPIREINQIMYVSSPLLAWVEAHSSEIFPVAGMDTTELYLDNQGITELPENFGEFTQLVELDLSNNRLSSLPASFGRLQNLQSLYIENNRFTTLPTVIGQLSSLRNLIAQNNPIESISNNFPVMESLDTLGLAHTRLRELPPRFAEMFPNLHFLYLDETPLESLPEGFFNLPLYEFRYENTSLPNETRTQLRDWLERRNIANVSWYHHQIDYTDLPMSMVVQEGRSDINRRTVWANAMIAMVNGDINGIEIAGIDGLFRYDDHGIYRFHGVGEGNRVIRLGTVRLPIDERKVTWLTDEIDQRGLPRLYPYRLGTYNEASNSITWDRGAYQGWIDYDYSEDRGIVIVGRPEAYAFDEDGADYGGAGSYYLVEREDDENEEASPLRLQLGLFREEAKEREEKEAEERIIEEEEKRHPRRLLQIATRLQNLGNLTMVQLPQAMSALGGEVERRLAYLLEVLRVSDTEEELDEYTREAIDRYIRQHPSNLPIVSQIRSSLSILRSGSTGALTELLFRHLDNDEREELARYLNNMSEAVRGTVSRRERELNEFSLAVREWILMETPAQIETALEVFRSMPLNDWLNREPPQNIRDLNVPEFMLKVVLSAFHMGQDDFTLADTLLILTNTEMITWFYSNPQLRDLSQEQFILTIDDFKEWVEEHKPWLYRANQQGTQWDNLLVDIPVWGTIFDDFLRERFLYEYLEQWLAENPTRREGLGEPQEPEFEAWLREREPDIDARVRGTTQYVLENIINEYVSVTERLGVQLMAQSALQSASQSALQSTSRGAPQPASRAPPRVYEWPPPSIVESPALASLSPEDRERLREGLRETLVSVMRDNPEMTRQDAIVESLRLFRGALEERVQEDEERLEELRAQPAERPEESEDDEAENDRQNMIYRVEGYLNQWRLHHLDLPFAQFAVQRQFFDWVHQQNPEFYYSTPEDVWEEAIDNFLNRD